MVDGFEIIAFIEFIHFLKTQKIDRSSLLCREHSSYELLTYPQLSILFYHHETGELQTMHIKSFYSYAPYDIPLIDREQETVDVDVGAITSLL